MEIESKSCSRCGELKPPSEFYRQGGRLESLCKSCKRKARTQRVEQPDKIRRQDHAKPQVSPAIPYEREQLPVFDESIFDSEKTIRKLGLSVDDVAELAAFIRWHIEQSKKGESKP